ncbi:MAG: hypothetical protein P8X74_07250 [Reinekea sp.]
MSALFSAEAIKGELDATIQQAQSALESFSEDVSDLNYLEQVLDYVGQLRGIFQILEEPGAVSVCYEMIAALNAIPADPGSAMDLLKAILDASSQVLVILSRYLELVSLQNKAIPSVLLPAVNSLRRARKAPIWGDSHFFEFSFKPGKPPLKTPVRITRASLIKLKKFRHMYQAGLVHLIRGKRNGPSMRYMSLALHRVDQVLGNAPCAPLWWVASAALDAMVQMDATVTPSRKRLFSQLEKELRVLIVNAPESLKRPSSSVLLKEFLYLIALNHSDSLNAKKVARFYKLPELKYSEHTLDEQRQVLFSPGRGVLVSVAEALKEDINGIKDQVDQVARGGSFSSKDLHGRLAKVADVYVMLGLHSPANVLKNQASIISNWADNAAPTQEELLNIANSVLYVESALSRNGLALAKRAISAYMDSNGDKLHLTNVSSTLEGVRGALIFLGGNIAADIVSRAITYIERELLEKGSLIEASQLELFADALSSLEFYLEGLLSGIENQDILKLAIHSLNALHV